MVTVNSFRCRACRTTIRRRNDLLSYIMLQLLRILLDFVLHENVRPVITARDCMRLGCMYLVKCHGLLLVHADPMGLWALAMIDPTPLSRGHHLDLHDVATTSPHAEGTRCSIQVRSNKLM